MEIIEINSLSFLLFVKKFRESNVFSKELIWRKNVWWNYFSISAMHVTSDHFSAKLTFSHINNKMISRNILHCILIIAIEKIHKINEITFKSYFRSVDRFHGIFNQWNSPFFCIVNVMLIFRDDWFFSFAAHNEFYTRLKRLVDDESKQNCEDMWMLREILDAITTSHPMLKIDASNCPTVDKLTDEMELYRNFDKNSEGISNFHWWEINWNFRHLVLGPLFYD